MFIRTGDTVEIISGDDKGQRGKVLEVHHDTGKVVVEGANLIRRHVRKSQKNPQGGRLSREAPFPMSKVMLVDPKTGEKCKVGVRYREDGAKERFNKKTGASISVVAPARKAYAKKA